MKRKVMLVGGKTHVVSLPAEFVKGNNIQKGEEVNLQFDGNTLSISTESIVKGGSISIDLENPSAVKPVMDLLYTLGLDEIKISCDDAVLSKIENSIENMFGFEIVRYLPKGCVIKSMVVLSSDIENMVNQCFFKVAHSKSKMNTYLTINNCLRCLSRRNDKKSGHYKQILVFLKRLVGAKADLVEELRVLVFKFDIKKAFILRCSNISQDAKDLIDVVIGMNVRC